MYLCECFVYMYVAVGCVSGWVCMCGCFVYVSEDVRICRYVCVWCLCTCVRVYACVGVCVGGCLSTYVRVYVCACVRVCGFE